MDSELTPQDFTVPTLGPATFRSPLGLSTVVGDGLGDFVPHGARVLYQVETEPGRTLRTDLMMERAGPREMIFFEPSQCKAAIVTCGGLCPGLNNVIRSIFLQLHHRYGVPTVLGIRYGYQGLNPAKGPPPLLLTPEYVERIHNQGGTVLRSSRGPEDPAVIVDYLQSQGINLLFCIGGDGTQRGTHAIAMEVHRRGAAIAVVGIPKTIDNDLPFVWRSFGYGTALEKAREAINCAHTEARGALNGIGLVQLMGRNAGFIAAGAALASQEANFVLIPEVRFPLEGPGGFLDALQKRIVARQHAVIVVAEGAGQHLFASESSECDASGNRKLQDIGVLLREKISRYFKAAGIAINMKYIDPSYIIRSVPANSDDALLCDAMARHAVHAAMAGKTDLLIGLEHGQFLHIPISTAVAQKKHLSPESEFWLRVIESTGQPAWEAGE
ncbi:MAG: ATP-dependent 6-phosphofructokinase [Planctomycetota bacterium]